MPFKEPVAMNIARSLFTILLSGLSAFAVQAEDGPSKKLIEFGWNMPDPAYLRDNLAAIESRPFDGITVRLPMGQNIFTRTPYPESAYREPRDVLADLEYSSLTDNFLIMWGTSDKGWLWTNDADWAAAETNIRNFARTAAIGGFRGILWDAETYGWSPWIYDIERYPDKSFAEVQEVVFDRGQSFVKIVQSEMPDARILSIWLLGTVIDSRGWSDDPSEGNYALYAAFISGMYAGLEGNARLIDGNESSYYYLGAKDFDEAGAYLRTGIAYLLPQGQPAAERAFSLGHAVYADGTLDLWRSPRFVGYYMANDQERLDLLSHNLYHALRTSDEYVWLYNENMNWWTGDIPPGMEEAVRDVRDRIRNDLPLAVDVDQAIAVARNEFDRKVSFYGAVTDPDGKIVEGVKVISGISDDDGIESACVGYNLNSFDCIVPFGWSGSFVPELDGYRFEPARVTVEKVESGTTISFTAIRE
jgi:hypothetical protein